jgi:UDP-2-acetamido-2-deoxy-ribo-hexuluronate aminotransferase
MALDIKPGDEVITTPFTFVATAEVIVLLGRGAGLRRYRTGYLQHRRQQDRSCDHPEDPAIMPVSLYGQPADMDEINAIAARHGLTVIEDAAQSFGAEYKGRKSCNLSTIGCTSFFPSKPLGCYGDGGAIFTSDDGSGQGHARDPGAWAGKALRSYTHRRRWAYGYSAVRGRPRQAGALRLGD